MDEARRDMIARLAVWLGGLLAVAAFALFSPFQCGQTDMVVTEPDLNVYDCSTLLVADQDGVEGPTPGTGPDHTGLDHLQTRMMVRALLAAALPLGVAVAGLIWMRRGRDLIRLPASRTAGLLYVVSSFTALAASMRAATVVLDATGAIAPLMIPVVLPLVRLLGSPARIRLGWLAFGAFVVVALPLALPIGFTYLPAGLLFLAALVTEHVSGAPRREAARLGLETV